MTVIRPTVALCFWRPNLLRNFDPCFRPSSAVLLNNEHPVNRPYTNMGSIDISKALNTSLQACTHSSKDMNRTEEGARLCTPRLCDRQACHSPGSGSIGSCGSLSTQISTEADELTSSEQHPDTSAYSRQATSRCILSMMGSGMARKQTPARSAQLSTSAAARQLFAVSRPELEAWLTKAERLQVGTHIHARSNAAASANRVVHGTRIASCCAAYPCLTGLCALTQPCSTSLLLVLLQGHHN